MTKIILLIAFTLGLFSVVSAQNSTLWECNRCHQQYIGNSPPYFTKCPATDNKQNHWWTRKSTRHNKSVGNNY